MVTIHLVMSKVDHKVKEEQLDFNTIPLWKDCEEALNKRYQHLSAEEASNAKFKSSDEQSKPKQDSSRFKYQRSSFACVNSQNKLKCFFFLQIKRPLHNDMSIYFCIACPAKTRVC